MFRRAVTYSVVAAVAVLLIAITLNVSARPKPLTMEALTAQSLEAAPDLDGGIAWINTAKPLTLKDLKGKIVVLDFWTLCCINCIHIMPDLAKLEAKYPNDLVVIGVHSPKFENEKDTRSIKKAVLRYEINHPVVNDADHKIWDRYNVSSWPTMAVIDPEGNLVGMLSGEGNYDILDRAIAKLIEIHRAKKTLNEKPIKFELLKDKKPAGGPLSFPGKVLADAKSNRLFIADSTNHRVVVTDLAGKKVAVIGDGKAGLKDGPFAAAQFNDPQGLAVDGETLYIADRKNHSIRAADLKAGTVTLVAGTGKQVQDTRGLDQPAPAKSTGMNSPWALDRVGRTLYISMAGDHQIWTLDLDKMLTGPFAGDSRENIKDGSLPASRFAQPSGLTHDATSLYVADSEVSAIRKLPLNGQGRVETLVGTGLFDFGDVDGVYPKSKLQHALGVAFHDGKLFVADTYNSKLKLLDPATKTLTTYLGGADPDGKGPLFDAPAGLSVAGGKLYVADTNANRIRVVDLATKAVTTLTLDGVTAPPKPVAPAATK